MYNKEINMEEVEINLLANFLFEHLEQYGDKKTSIKQAIRYALQKTESFGGSVIMAWDKDDIIGAVVINQTGMQGYIPENILVYIATHKERRGEGIGKLLLQKAIEETRGDIALHVEANNPAKHLYTKFGFKNPYLEMRLNK